jgi:hypothetical protein
LSEGNGEALYEIGVDDDGTIKGKYAIKILKFYHLLIFKFRPTYRRNGNVNKYITENGSSS